MMRCDVDGLGQLAGALRRVVSLAHGMVSLCLASCIASVPCSDSVKGK